VVLAVAIPLAFMLTDDGPRRILLIGSLMLVIIVELLNTAIEKLADRRSLIAQPSKGEKHVVDAIPVSRRPLRGGDGFLQKDA
jgi:diacylglycerol kinase